MKLFAFILSLYVLVLTASPCMDVPQDYKLDSVEMAQHSQDNNDQHNTNHCSPFCTCNCCTSPVLFQEYAIQQDCYSFSGNQYAPIPYEHLSSPSATIWQPPKIA